MHEESHDVLILQCSCWWNKKSDRHT